MRTFSIYENSGGDVGAVKNGLRLGVLFGILWAVHVKFWWLVVITAVGLVASEVNPDLEVIQIPLLVLYVVAAVKAEAWEVKRFEGQGYSFIEFIEGDSGKHAIALFKARKDAPRRTEFKVGRWPPGTVEMLLLILSMQLFHLEAAHPWSLVAFVSLVIVVAARGWSRDRRSRIESGVTGRPLC